MGASQSSNQSKQACALAVFRPVIEAHAAKTKHGTENLWADLDLSAEERQARRAEEVAAFTKAQKPLISPIFDRFGTRFVDGGLALPLFLASLYASACFESTQTRITAVP